MADGQKARPNERATRAERSSAKLRTERARLVTIIIMNKAHRCQSTGLQEKRERESEPELTMPQVVSTFLLPSCGSFSSSRILRA